MDGEVSRHTFDDCDTDTKLGILFDRTEKMIKTDAKILDRLDTIDQRIRKQNTWYKIISGIGGFFGGLVSSITILFWRL